MLQKYFFPLNFANYKYFFRSKFFIFWMKDKADLETSNNPNRKSNEKELL